MPWTVVGAIAMALAVGCGAFGAHGLKARLDPEAMGWWQTAANYHLVHGLGLFAVDAVARRGGGGVVEASGWCLLAGLLLFSGSLYAMALGGPRWLGAVTPIGGTAWLVGWVLLAAGAWRS